MRKGIKGLYLLTTNVALVLIVAAFASKNTGSESANIVHIEPDKIQKESEEITAYSYDIQEENVAGQGIAFYTNHQNVVVYCDRASVYEVQSLDSIWGHTPGNQWNFVHIPDGTRTVKIALEKVYPSVEMKSIFVYAGNDRELYCSILEASMLSMASSAIILLIGIALIAIWYFVQKRADSTNGIFYLGVLALVFGLWAFNETDGSKILFDNRVACSFAAFILLKAMAPTFVIFVREYTGEKQGPFWDVFSRLIVVEAFVTVALHMVGLLDLKETVITTHLILVICLSYAFALVIKAVHNKTVVVKPLLLAIAGIIVIIAVTAGFINYFTGREDVATVSHIGFLIFATLVAAQSANDALKMMEKGKYAAIYEELAITDTLTGLYNRNAYHIDTKKIVDLTGFMIMTFDLNDLKECNDTKGHAQGDKYIVTAAGMIEQLLAPYGRCYRIGGDEFCAIVRNGASCPVENLLLKLEMEQIRYNANISEEGYPIRIAAGYAMYDKELDEDIEEMRSRSDILMYRNKRKIKEELGSNREE